MRLAHLLEHEHTIPEHLRELREQIRKDGVLKRPIAVDAETKIILDGHHRFNSLRSMGCSRIPAYLVNYNSPCIIVRGWDPADLVTKEMVVRAGLSGRRFQPKYSRHLVKVNGRLYHISKIERIRPRPLTDLS